MATTNLGPFLSVRWRRLAATVALLAVSLPSGSWPAAAEVVLDADGGAAPVQHQQPLELPWNGSPCGPALPPDPRRRSAKKDDDRPMCKPSYLIIGAGKSGTSSLYYYLQNHPQVEPAATKQIQYFDHGLARGDAWYLGRFPRGMPARHVTGEASPGYMVYHHVPAAVIKSMPEARIIAVVRDPVDRIWSSYHYNYLDLLKGEGGMVPAPLEAFVEVETGMIDVCMAANGYTARHGVSIPGTKPLDVIASCFSKDPARARQQFVDVARVSGKSPPAGLGVPAAHGAESESIELPRSNVHLYQQIVARGLYSPMLEWWYEVFPAEQIHVVCTEALKHRAADTMSSVASFIGLDHHDFVIEGMYNTRGNRGYESLTPWAEADGAVAKAAAIDAIPGALQASLHAYYSPFNQRLFELTGARCKWVESDLEEERGH